MPRRGPRTGPKCAPRSAPPSPWGFGGEGVEGSGGEWCGVQVGQAAGRGDRGDKSLAYSDVCMYQAGDRKGWKDKEKEEET